MRGIEHEYEPEVDSLSYIDFEDEMPQTDGIDRFAWHHKMVGHVVFEVFGGPANTNVDLSLVTDTLFLSATTAVYQLDETELWNTVARWANAKGFDTYNSDTRFELFPGGTPQFDPES